jgi:hypothetical protein
MAVKTDDKQLKRKINALMKSMDFVSQHPALKRDDKTAQRYAEIYQQLGLAWEYLGLQCKHRSRWRKASAGKLVCKVCGHIKGVKERWILIPSGETKKKG